MQSPAAAGRGLRPCLAGIQSGLLVHDDPYSPRTDHGPQCLINAAVGKERVDAHLPGVMLTQECY